MSGGGFSSGDRSRGRRARLEDMQAVMRTVAPVEAPDLTDSILAAVDQHRPFTSRSTRRLVFIGRIVLGLSVCVMTLGIMLMHRYAPRAVAFAPAPPAPLSEVVQVASVEASAGLTVLLEKIETVKSAPSAIALIPIEQPGRPALFNVPEAFGMALSAAAYAPENASAAAPTLPTRFQSSPLLFRRLQVMPPIIAKAPAPQREEFEGELFPLVAGSAAGRAALAR